MTESQITVFYFLSEIIRSLLLAFAPDVCYHVKIKNRREHKRCQAKSETALKALKSQILFF